MAGSTDVLVPLECHNCWHLMQAWASHVEQGQCYCNQCESKLSMANVYVPDVDGNPPHSYDGNGAD